ncbi:MAG: DNA polymerase III subunit beta [Alphaproteobacteria bacterium]|nr:DNA polymerase III subunit beta [Alphaproteobacteria bacterium]
MKIIVDRAILLKSLLHIQSVVERRNTIPILSNVLIEAEQDRLDLTATDLDITIVEKIPSQTLAPGSVTLPAHTLYDIVRKLPEGCELHLEESKAGQLFLKAGRSKFTLSTLPRDDFPSLAVDDLTHNFFIPADFLKKLIDRTKFAISTEEARYYLNGIFLHTLKTSEGIMLRSVATDGHRLARVEVKLSDNIGLDSGIIIPRKTVTELKKLVDEFNDPIKISFSDTKISFSVGDAFLVSKLIDRAFPDYQKVIPENNDKMFTVERNMFAQAVDRVATICSDKSRAVKLHLKPSVLSIHASSPENGTAFEEVEINYKADDLEIGFNARYLMDIVQQIEGEKIKFSLSDAASPVLINDTEDQAALYILMPMRV